MGQLELSGEVEAMGWQEGATGRLTGTLTGLFQGYRHPGLPAGERQYVVETEAGALAFTVRYPRRLGHQLPPQPVEHPFSYGRNPLAYRSQAAHEESTIRPTRPKRMAVTLTLDPARGSGLFAGANGALDVMVPIPPAEGKVRIATSEGTLETTFTETMEDGVLTSYHTVDGAASSGRYHHAQGALTFRLTIVPPNFTVGPYSGLLTLAE